MTMMKRMLEADYVTLRLLAASRKSTREGTAFLHGLRLTSRLELTD